MIEQEVVGRGVFLANMPFVTIIILSVLHLIAVLCTHTMCIVHNSPSGERGSSVANSLVGLTRRLELS